MTASQAHTEQCRLHDGPRLLADVTQRDLARCVRLRAEAVIAAYSPPAHRMTPTELRAALTRRDPALCADCDHPRHADRPCTFGAYRHCPTVSPWVQRAIAGTLPAPTLAPTQAEIDAELFDRYRFAFRVR